jgi:acetyl/propionyl-CoA carboxylase alpha subunit
MLRQRAIVVLQQLRHESTKRIESVLVANRGEIALRIMRTARKLNIKSVAIFSDADSNAQHTKFADQAFRIGKPPPTESYLCGDRVIDVALKAGVQVESE